MKKFIASFVTASLVAGTAFGLAVQNEKPRYSLNRPAVSEGTGNSNPTVNMAPNSSGQLERAIACFEYVYLSVTPTALTGTIQGGPISNTNWIDTSAWSDAVIETYANGGSVTILVESNNTWTITGVAVLPTKFITTNTIITAAGANGGVQTHVSFLGKWTRIRISDNNTDRNNTAQGQLNSGTISIGVTFRRL